MTDDIIRRLREAIAAGPSPGEWRVSKYRDGRNALIYDADDFELARVCYPNRDANAALIAACNPAAIRELLAEMDRLRGLLCKCDMRTRLVGDGCEFCNPQLADELEKEQR